MNMNEKGRLPILEKMSNLIIQEEIFLKKRPLKPSQCYKPITSAMTRHSRKPMSLFIWPPIDNAIMALECKKIYKERKKLMKVESSATTKPVIRH